MDTSTWLDCWTRWYPKKTFPSLWNNLGAMIDSNKIITPVVVLDELLTVEDGIAQWLKERPHGIYDPTEEVQVHVRAIMGRYRNFVELRGKSGGDPWVIASALEVHGIVVTGEKRTGDMETPHIPNVCDAFNVQSMHTIEFICCHGWEF
ncbi:MAG: DUF4411 family protein [Caldilineaceae bacterium]